MNLCSNNHDEVCFEGRQCPCCQIIEDKDNALSDRDEKINQLTELNDEVVRQAEEYKSSWKEAQGEVDRLLKGQGDGER